MRQSSRLGSALACQNKQRPPIWLMRQAGRHLASYRDWRNRFSFSTLVHEPDLIVEISRLPLQAYPLDAAIVFSDILLPLEAMGFHLVFDEGKGPLILNPLTGTTELHRVPEKVDLRPLHFLSTAIEQLKKTLSMPLLGFSGAPFTLASYLIEAKTHRDTPKTKRWLFEDPSSFQHLLFRIADLVAEVLVLQIQAGADAVQIFDSWAHSLSPTEFSRFCIPALERVVARVRKGFPHIPILFFCRNSALFVPLFAHFPHSIGFSLDWSADLPHIRRILGPHVPLQGNLDPSFLYSPLTEIRQKAQTLLANMAKDPGYIFNLGHGLLPDTPEEAVQALVSTVVESKGL